MSQRRFSLLAVLSPILAILIPAGVSAQGQTGALTGTVKDSQGGVLSGTTVRVASPALIGGELQATTTASGQWRFPILPPGVYTLTVELAPQFETYREEGIRVGAGAALDVTVTLKLAGLVVQSVDVPGSYLDAARSGLETRFGSDYIETMPTRRYSMFDLIRNTPGVSPTSPSSGTVNTVSVFGSGVNENAFLIDDTNFTCPCQGVSRAEPSVDVIQEVQVQSTGASVEFGNIQGAVFNVVTKQGGARYQYDASYYGQWAGLTAQPVALLSFTGGRTGYERIRYRDFTTNLGGPILRDRLWFFGGYQYLRDHDSQPGADAHHPRKYEQNKVFGKLTWKVSSTTQLTSSYHEEIWVNGTPSTRTNPFNTTLRLNASVPGMTFANVRQVLSDSTFWEARVGRFVVDQKTDPSSGDFTTPARRDQVTSVVSGNALQVGTFALERITAKGVLHRHQTAWPGSDHHFKFGVEVERGEHASTGALPGGVTYVDNGGAKSAATYREPWLGGGLFITGALFASDSISLTDRVAADAGIRFDHTRAISPDLEGVDANGQPADGFTKGRGTLYTWNAFSPRLGVTVKLDADGRTMLRGTYGRFNQGVLTGELEMIHPGATTMTTRAYESATDGYTGRPVVVDPTLNLAIDPHTRSPRTDEFSLAVDRRITPLVSSSVAYVRKRGRTFIGWTDTGGTYRETTRTLGDTTLPVYELTNATSDRRFLLTNPENRYYDGLVTNPGRLFLDYDGLVVAVEKRLSRGWQASGSYTFSRTHGVQVTSNAPVGDAQFSTIARGGFLTFGQDPNDLTNAEGRLLNDRPHVFRASGLVRLPRTGVLLSASAQHFTGKPWAATALVKLPQNPGTASQRILIEPRGSRRLSSQTVLDFRVSKEFPAGSIGAIDLRLDVLNLLNDSAEEALSTDVLLTASGRNDAFGQKTLFMDPRRAMLSVRLQLGR